MQMVSKKWWLMFFLCFTFFVCGNAQASSQFVPLPKEQAFQLSTKTLTSNSIELNWKIAPGYYLYVKKIHVAFSPLVETRVELPQGKMIKDKQNIQYDIYADHVTIPVIFLTQTSPLSMQVDYQGCSSDGFCYPPMSEYFNLDLSKGQLIKISNTDSVQLTSLFTQQNHVETLLKTGNVALIFLLFTTLGIMLAFTPCVLPMFPILMGIIAGQNKGVTPKQGLFLSLSYVLGMASAYAGIGLVAAYMGHSLQVSLQKPEYIIGSSIVFLLLSLSLFGFYELRMPRSWQNTIGSWTHQFKGGAHIGVFMMGVISTLIVSPCVTAPLAGVLLFIANTGNLVLGAAALFVMGIGMGIPLILIGVSQGKWRIKTGPWMEFIKYIFGFVMLGIAIWLLSRIASYYQIMLISSGLLLLLALSLVLSSHFIYKNKIRNYLGWMSGFSGMIILIGGIHSGVVPNKIKTAQLESTQHSFIVVRNITELGKQLQLAKLKNQPVILDFYADWCTSCVAMDRDVFGMKTVQQTLKNYTLIRADLSENTRADEELLKKFNIIAPPTILFFDKNGLELSERRIIGEVNAKEFLERL